MKLKLTILALALACLLSTPVQAEGNTELPGKTWTQTVLVKIVQLLY